MSFVLMSSENRWNITTWPPYDESVHRKSVHLSLCLGLWDERGAEAVSDLPPGGGAQRSRPSASGEESYCQHPKVHQHHTDKYSTHIMHMYVATEYSTLLFYFSALSQDEQDDAQLRIEDILQMVRDCRQTQIQQFLASISILWRLWISVVCSSLWHHTLSIYYYTFTTLPTILYRFLEVEIIRSYEQDVLTLSQNTLFCPAVRHRKWTLSCAWCSLEDR